MLLSAQRLVRGVLNAVRVPFRIGLAALSVYLAPLRLANDNDVLELSIPTVTRE
jgi:hypothetical protein